MMNAADVIWLGVCKLVNSAETIYNTSNDNLINNIDDCMRFI